jgi:hypothetical protein
MRNRRSTLERIDTHLIIQHEKETNYWRNVFRRVVAVVKLCHQEMIISEQWKFCNVVGTYFKIRPILSFTL